MLWSRYVMMTMVNNQSTVTYKKFAEYNVLRYKMKEYVYICVSECKNVGSL